MKDINSVLRKTLAKKHLWKQAIWVIAINSLKKIYPNSNIDGYVKFDILFIKTANTELKIKLYRQQKEIISQVNNNLQKIGYNQKISKIFIKFAQKNNNNTHF